MDFKFRSVLSTKRKSILLFAMRIFIFSIGTTAFGFTTGNLLSQDIKIVVDTDKTITVEQVFDMIDKQTDYSFVYKPNLFNPSWLLLKLIN